METYLLLHNNKKKYLNELRNELSDVIFQSELQTDISRYIVENVIYIDKNKDIDTYKYAINFIRLKSKYVKNITALIYILKNKIFNIKTIVCSDLEKNIIFKFAYKEVLERNIHLETYMQDKKIFINNIIDKKYIYIKFPIKIILHKLYRIFFLFSKNSINKHNSLIRTYVEDTFKFFPIEIKSSNLFIYPFHLKFKRQLNFIRNLKKSYKNQYTLVGFPYSFALYLKLLIKEKVPFMILAKVEIDAYKKHYKDIENFNKNLNKVFSIDEYEPSSFILCKKLKEKNIYVINKIHGVGLYCPYLTYDELYVFNKQQEKFYTKYNLGIKINYYKFNFCNKNKYKLTNTCKRITNKKKKIKIRIVFILGNMYSLNLTYDHKFQIKLAQYLKEILISLKGYNLKYYLKLHPNTNSKEKEILENLNIPFISTKEINSLKDKFIFITLYSTALYDFINKGPFLFVGNKLLDARIIYGKEIRYTKINNLKEVLLKIINNIEEEHLIQIKNLCN